MSRVGFPGYVLFEGLDFTGKTTIAKKLEEKFQQEGPVPAIYNKGFFHNVDIEETETLAAQLDPLYKEMYFKGLYALDKVSDLPSNHIIQDRYFPSILFYGLMTNGTKIPSPEEIGANFIKPIHTILFECSYDSKLARAKSRSKLWRLERMVLESSQANNIMEEKYRQIIEDVAPPFTIINTDNLSEDETVSECYKVIIDEGCFLEKVRTGDLCVSWEPRIYPNTAHNYFETLQAGITLAPIVVHRVYSSDGAHLINLVEDGRHRAYAHLLAGSDSIEAYVIRREVDDSFFKNTPFTSLSDFGTK